MTYTSERTLIDPARRLSIDQIYAALPDRCSSNPAIMKRLDEAGYELAPATYKDMFWEPDPDGRGMRHSIPIKQLLTLMLALYLHKGGPEPEVFESRWSAILSGNMPA